MLVLTRKQGERIHIGEGIVVKVIKSGRNTVKIGIEAPQDVRVMRAELCEPKTVKPASPMPTAMPNTAMIAAAAPVSDQFPHVA